jgi:pimeloyl-ACP methyl ester carboxylesterase
LLTALIVLLGLVAALGSFTAVQTVRIEARHPPTGRRIDVGDGAIHVLDQPARVEERGAILLIHGASGNASDMFVALAERLANRGFRVLSVDRPGHGWSDRIGGRAASSPVLQAEMLRRAAETLGVAHAVVAVHSLGAITGLAMALDRPEFVRALALIAPVSHPWPGGVARYYKIGAHPLFGPPFRWLLTLPTGMVWMAAAVASVFAPNPAPAGFIEATRLSLVLRPRHFLANCEDVACAEAAVAALSPRYGQIRAPTEVVTGDSDGVVYAHIHSEGLARDIPGARLTVLARVGHSPHHVARDRVVETILEAERRAVAREFESGRGRLPQGVAKQAQ